MRALGFAAVALAATGAFTPAGGATVVVDDFETGSIHLVGVPGAYVTGNASVVAPSHAIAAVRTVGVQTMNAAGMPMMADVNAWTTADDVIRFTPPTGGGIGYLIHQPAVPVDLTDAGLNDRIEVTMPLAPGGMNLSISLKDAFGDEDGLLIHPAVGANYFPFSVLGGVDLTQITEVKFTMSIGQPFPYEISDIRAMRPGAFWLRFEIPVETAVGPPFPLLAHEFELWNADPSDIQSVRLLTATRVATGDFSGIALTAMDSGDDGPGRIGMVEAKWNEPAVPYASTAFDLRVDLSALSGVEPEPFLPALPAVTSTPSGFLLQYEVQLMAVGGEMVGTSLRQMPVDVIPGQAIALSNVQVHALSPGAGPRLDGEPAGFRVTFDAVGGAAVDTDLPLFAASFTGDLQHAATTDVAESGTSAGAALHARPTVTRGATELRLARPAERASVITLYDVSGRRVRALPLAAGAAAATWDGRDEAGRAAPAGVYLARFADGTVSAATRVVRMR